MRIGLRLGPFYVSERVGGRRRRKPPSAGFWVLFVLLCLLIGVIVQVTK